MILNTDQAQAVYSAMCALNNVGMRMHCQDKSVMAHEYADGVVHVSSQNWPAIETYPSQQAFAEAYGVA